ncbi:hypothetical protein Tco_0519360 [Tanacetum coccineum]
MCGVSLSSGRIPPLFQNMKELSGWCCSCLSIGFPQKEQSPPHHSFYVKNLEKNGSNSITHKLLSESLAAHIGGGSKVWPEFAPYDDMSIEKQWKAFLDSNKNIGFTLHDDGMMERETEKDDEDANSVDNISGYADEHRETVEGVP